MNKQIKAISNENNVTITVVDMKDTINNIVKIDSKIVNEMSSRIALSNALLMMEEKNADSLIISLNLNSNVKKIYSEIYGNKYLRNQIILSDSKEQTSQSKINTLEVNKYFERKNISKSIVEIENENIDEMFTKYLKQSDQIDSLIITAIEMKDDLQFSQTKAILIKALPNVKDQNQNYIKSLDVNKIRQKLLESSVDKNFINEVFGNCKITKTQSTYEYRCGCNEQNFINLLKQQNKEQLQELIQNDDEIKLICNYCLKETIIKTGNLIFN